MDYKFPQYFLWGAAASSYQIEGAVDAGGRKPSIWDTFSHTPGKIYNGDTGDTACDHYNRFIEDVELLHRLGVKAYRFSIAWPRIFPDGKGSPNEKGMEFYMKLVDELIKYAIKPVATLYHWDLPQALQDEGGWGVRKTVDYFKDYAGFVFDRLGDKVFQWITLNEPWVSAFAGNFTGQHAPGLKNLSAALEAAHHLLLAHGETVKLYREKNLKGTIGIALSVSPVYPGSDSKKDLYLAEIAHTLINTWFMDPILKGQYSNLLDPIFQDYSVPMPRIFDNDLKVINTPVDFIGINYYRRQVIKSGEGFFGIELVKPEGKYTDMDWEVYPEGLYDILARIRQDYGNISIYITENGAAYKDVPDPQKNIHDIERISYIRQHILAAHRAVQDGINLRGYFLWSFIDNFEWTYGYSKRFGLAYVDYPTQERIIKNSGNWYKNVIESNGIME